MKMFLLCRSIIFLVVLQMFMVTWNVFSSKLEFNNKKLFKKKYFEPTSIEESQIATVLDLRSLIECGGFCLANVLCDAFFWNASKKSCMINSGKNLVGDETTSAVNGHIDNNLTPVNGLWSKWGIWSDCSKTCGNGTQSRNRTCVEPMYGGIRTCGGNATEINNQTCNLKTCPSTWNLITGGDFSGTLLSSVELFNYETLQSCELDPIPIPIVSHFGTVLNGVPMSCGGRSTSGSILTCFKFDKPSKKFEQMNLQLPYAEVIATNINVPNLGWYFYAGFYTGALVNSNRLASINSPWTNGPPPPNNYDFRQTAVQISDNKTAFIGGTYSPRQINVFDWTTLTYTVQTSAFTLDKLHSGCAVLKDSNGDPIVVAFGGSTIGTESWNPKTGTIQMLNDTFPRHMLNINYFSQVITVEGSEELIYYQEQTGAPADVLKYVYATNSWTQVGTLTTNKVGFLALPVEDVQC